MFRESIFDLSSLFIDEFDNGKYHANVTTLAINAWIDRINSYPYVDEAVSDRVAELERKYTDTVHPMDIGYYQWADAYYAKIRSFLAGNL